MAVFDNHSLFAFSTIKTVISQTTTTLIVTVTPGDGSLFAANQQIVVAPAYTQALLSNAMIGRITGVTGDQLTIDISTGSREGSTQIAVTTGMQMQNGFTPKVLTDIETAVNSNASSLTTLNAKLPAGAIVGTTDAQTLTNKTIDFTANTILNNTANTDGWIPAGVTLVYVSATSFKVVGADKTAVFSKGTRVKLTDAASTKYFVVTSSSVATDTTVNVTGGSDYTLSGGVISNPFYSYAANPQGYPGFFNYTPTFVGFSTNPTVSMSRFSVIGSKCTIFHSESNGGVSNSTGFTITAPITSAAITNAEWIGSPAQVKDNGGATTSPCLVLLSNNSTTISIYLNYSVGSTWTASGAKQLYRFTIEYEF